METDRTAEGKGGFNSPICAFCRISAWPPRGTAEAAKCHQHAGTIVRVAADADGLPVNAGLQPQLQSLDVLCQTHEDKRMKPNAWRQTHGDKRMKANA